MRSHTAGTAKKGSGRMTRRAFSRAAAGGGGDAMPFDRERGDAPLVHRDARQGGFALRLVLMSQNAQLPNYESLMLASRFCFSNFSIASSKPC